MIKRIVLVDGYNTFIRSFLQIPIRNDNGDHFGGVYGFINSIKTIAEATKPHELLVAWDGVNSSYRRKQILPEYKANRTKNSWVKGGVGAFDFETEQQQKENFNYQLKRIREYIEYLPFKEIQLPYVEADDIIAEYVQYILTNELTGDTQYEIVIYSSDSDYRQLIKDTQNFKVICFNPIKKNLMTRDKFIEENGFLPENYSIIKSFIGDTSDNVKGLVKGLGIKTILKMYGELFLTKKVSIDEVLNYSKQLCELKSNQLSPSMLKNHKLVVDNCETLLTNWRVMQLIDDSEISIQSKDAIKNLAIAKPNQYDKYQLLKMFMSDKMNSHISKYSDWERIFLSLNQNTK